MDKTAFKIIKLVIDNEINKFGCVVFDTAV